MEGEKRGCEESKQTQKTPIDVRNFPAHTAVQFIAVLLIVVASKCENLSKCVHVTALSAI